MTVWVRVKSSNSGQPVFQRGLVRSCNPRDDVYRSDRRVRPAVIDRWLASVDQKVSKRTGLEGNQEGGSRRTAKSSPLGFSFFFLFFFSLSAFFIASNKK